MTSSRRGLAIPFLLLLVASGLAGLHLVDPDGGLGTVTYLVATCGAPVIAAVAWLKGRTDPRVAALLTFGLASSAVGEVLWEVHLARTGAAPDVSGADLGWVASYVFIGLALVMLVRRSSYRLRRDPDALIDMSIAAVLVALGVWLLWVQPTLADSATSWPVRVVWALYPVLDAALLALLVRMLVHRAVRGPGVALLAGGLSMWLLADVGYLSLTTWAWAGPAMNVGWMFGSLLLAVSVWLLGDADSDRSLGSDAGTRSTISRGRVVAAVLPLAVPWAVVLWAHLVDRAVNPVPLVVASAALCALVYARMIHLLDLQRGTEELYRVAAANSADATLIVSPQGLLLHDSPGLALLLDDEHAGRAHSHVSELVALIAEGSSWFDDVVRRVTERPGAVIEREVEVTLPGRPDVWMSVRVVNLLDTPHVRAILVNLHDISDRKRVERQLEHQAFHDPLTGLPNRLLFADRLAHAFDHRFRSGRDPAVLFLDLDGFKGVNDRLGHEAGDCLLVEVAGRLSDAVRTGDTVARLGGDEFAVLIEHSDSSLADARSVADRVLEDLTGRPVRLEGTSLTVTASIGIAPGGTGATPGSLLRDADTAMYHAKAAGRARAVVYDSEMRERDDEQMRVHAELPRALTGDQLRLEYQPVVDLSSGRITGFEALLRWHHPELGRISPEVFIPVAERSGDILEIGRWVLDTACSQLALWRRAFDPELSMSVNVSARQLADPELPTTVLEALRRHDLEPTALVLEITETAIINDAHQARDMLEKLRGLGIRFAIDDFGTGYSSLSYLQQLPIDILKIDRSFITGIREESELPDIVRGILDLATTLHLQTVAEGIETTAQLDQLRANRCDTGQGFLFARSLDADAARELLRAASKGSDTGPRANSLAAGEPA